VENRLFTSLYLEALEDFRELAILTEINGVWRDELYRSLAHLMSIERMIDAL